MIKVNQFIINETLIKFAIPYFTPPKEGNATSFPIPATKIVFTDNSEMIFECMDINQLFIELEKVDK